MTNNQETRSKLAKEVIETMTLDDLTSFVMQRLEQDYEKDSDLFEEDMEVYLPQEAGIFQNPFEVKPNMSNGSQPNVQDVIDYENGDMDWDRLVDFFQNLIDSEASCLDDEDGDYAIMVRSLIVDGYCESKEVQ